MSSAWLDMREQPAALHQLLYDESALQAAGRIAHLLSRPYVHHVAIVGRGSSHHAALYAAALFGTVHQRPVWLVPPSLFSLYAPPPRLTNTVVIGISQSGYSDDVNAVLAEAKRQDVPTVALVNMPEAPLAQQADEVFWLQAGHERAVAATKTYSAELAAIAMISATWRAEQGMGVAAQKASEQALAQLQAVPGATQQSLDQAAQLQKAVAACVGLDRCFVLGRGYGLASAWEWSLKLKEMAGVAAQAYSAAEFQHGPVALVQPGEPVLVVADEGPAAAEWQALTLFLAQERQAHLVVLGNAAATLEQATFPLDVRGGALAGARSSVPARSGASGNSAAADATQAQQAATQEWLGPLHHAPVIQAFCQLLAEARQVGSSTQQSPTDRLQKITRTR